MTLSGSRIGIDVRALTPPMSGVGVALREILQLLPTLTPETDYFCYTTRAAAALNLPEGRFHLRVGRGLSARWGTVWLQTGIRPILVADGLDLFWGPLQVLPVSRRMPPIAMVVTVQDLVFHRFPETMTWRNRLALGRYARPSLRRASAVLTASKATADALAREFGVEPATIRVIPYAAGEQFRPQDRGQARRRVGERFGVHAPYLLFVGTLEPRKNLDGLLTALAYLVDEGRFDGEVMIVGAQGWSMAPFYHRLQATGLKERLHFTGYVEEAALPDLYCAARLFVMPSLYEGFGLPVVEAMSCGTPVVCTNRDPFPEITQGAARLAPAEDPRVLAEAIAAVWGEKSLRRELSRRGLERAADFSWQKTAHSILRCFEEVLHGRQSSPVCEDGLSQVVKQRA